MSTTIDTKFWTSHFQKFWVIWAYWVYFTIIQRIIDYTKPSSSLHRWIGKPPQISVRSEGVHLYNNRASLLSMPLTVPSISLTLLVQRILKKLFFSLQLCRWLINTHHLSTQFANILIVTSWTGGKSCDLIKTWWFCGSGTLQWWWWWWTLYRLSRYTK